MRSLFKYESQKRAGDSSGVIYLLSIVSAGANRLTTRDTSTRKVMEKCPQNERTFVGGFGISVMDCFRFFFVKSVFKLGQESFSLIYMQITHRV